MIGIKSTGDFHTLDSFFKRMLLRQQFSGIELYALLGLNALESATPRDTGKTAASWQVQVSNHGSTVKIEWFNTNVVDGVNIAIILQYGHGTGTGGYVSGYDYINPTMRPIFDMISENVWKEVTRA
jgi:hypothetical protein